MISHVSMPADDCAAVARVLAEMIGGVALRFPPGGPDAWNVWPKHNQYQIVITPRGQLMIEGPAEMTWASSTRRSSRASETHFALEVLRPAEEILALARAAGWPARICDRGGFFDLIEVWVESAYLVEMLDPAQAADYRRAMTIENWTKAMSTDRLSA